MRLAKIILFIGLVNFGLFEFVLTQESNEVNVESPSYDVNEFLGKWYYIAVMKRIPDSSFECIEQNVSKDENDDLIIKWSGKDETGQLFKQDLYGEIDKFELKISWSNKVPTYHSISVYNNGDHIVLCQKPHSDVCTILSRQSTIPKKSKDIYERLARNKHLRISYIKHENCGEQLIE